MYKEGYVIGFMDKFSAINYEKFKYKKTTHKRQREREKEREE
jgi:hypothetical protein